MDFEFYDDYIGESLHINVNGRIRDAVHNIVVTDLEYGEEMKITKLSELLNSDYNIKINDELLGKLIFINWWMKDDYSIFKEDDKVWLDVWSFRKTIERKKRKNIKPLGKSRRKLIKKEEEEKRISAYNKTYKSSGGWYSRNFGGHGYHW